MPNLLVVDDEPNVLYSLEKSLQSDTLDVFTARTARQGIEMVQERQPDAVLLDVRLADMSGLEAFDRIRQIDPRLPVIIITAFASTETAIEAMKRGAFEYLLKPVDFHQIRDVVNRAIELRRLTRVPAVFNGTAEAVSPDSPVDRIVGHAAAMQEVYKAIGRIAPQDVTVLILGESGTGKELIARAIYQHSRRSEGSFLAINCAAIPETLLESELFGHERGAFTGAERQRVGKFEQAHQGTLFLDEIGDMSGAPQAKVLRLLQEQRFERIGGNETIQTDVRLIAATNKNLDQAVVKGGFRQDLLYRLNGFTIRLPALRDRREDLPALIEYFIKHFNPGLGKQVHRISPETLRLLEEHSWPGNVRELQSTIKYALVHAVGDILTPSCLPENLRNGTAPASQFQPPCDDKTLDLAQTVQSLLRAGESEIYRKVTIAADRVILESVLRHARGNQVQASELLGISRTTLRAKLRGLGMTSEKTFMSDYDQDD